MLKLTGFSSSEVVSAMVNDEEDLDEQEFLKCGTPYFFSPELLDAQ